jgi:hypothetical protein
VLDAVAKYALTLPERVLRSAAAVTGGLVRELSDVVVPAALRRTQLYDALAGATLRFLIEQVGQVEGAYPAGDRLAEDFVMRRAAGNGLEIAGFLAFRASPVWVMAGLADLSGAGRHLIGQIAGELQKEGLLDPASRFETVDQVLEGLERSAGQAAQAINAPPLDVAGLRREWSEIRSQASPRWKRSGRESSRKRRCRSAARLRSPPCWPSPRSGRRRKGCCGSAKPRAQPPQRPAPSPARRCWVTTRGLWTRSGPPDTWRTGSASSRLI